MMQASEKTQMNVRVGDNVETKSSELKDELYGNGDALGETLVTISLGITSILKRVTVTASQNVSACGPTSRAKGQLTALRDKVTAAHLPLSERKTAIKET